MASTRSEEEEEEEEEEDEEEEDDEEEEEEEASFLTEDIFVFVGGAVRGRYSSISIRYKNNYLNFNFLICKS